MAVSQWPASPGGPWGAQGPPRIIANPSVSVIAPNPNVGQPAQANVKKPSDQRFRSFAERYVIARAHYFRQEPELLVEDQWACVLDAKRLYAMIERTGQNIEPEEGVF